MRVGKFGTKAGVGRSLLAAFGLTVLVAALVPSVAAFDFPQFQPQPGLKGFANGQTVHVGALEAGGGGPRVADVEVAWAAASVDDGGPGLDPAKENEMGRVFQPKLSNKHTYARGSGLEVGLVTNVDDPATPDDEGANQVQLGQVQLDGGEHSESAAPPPPVVDGNPDQDELISLDADPLAFASLLRSNTIANWNTSGLVHPACVLTDDISRGQAYAADVALLDGDAAGEDPEGLESPLLALSAQDPQRAVSQNTTRLSLVPNGVANHFGLQAQVRQTIAPIRLLDVEGVPESLKGLTIELLGEWVLTATATGVDSPASSITFTPDTDSPKTVVLRVINDVNEVLGELTTQDIPIFGQEGLSLDDLGIPTNLIDLVIGEDPRALSTFPDAPDEDSAPDVGKTRVEGAIDVLRLKLLNNLPDVGELADVRVGHMEVSAQVPDGGIECDIPVDKTANPTQIAQGGTSNIAFRVHNPYDCPLENVVLTDEIRQETGDPKFRLVSSSRTPASTTLPTAPDQTTANVVWNLGTIPAGGSVDVTMVLEATSGGGELVDIARATGVLAACKGEAVAGVAVAKINLTGVSPLVKIAIETPRTGAPAAATAATGSIIALVATGLGLLVRRRFR